MNNDVFIGASDVYDYVTCNIQAERNELKLPSQHEKIVVMEALAHYVRHVEEGWPFPHWDVKTRKQLKPVPIEYEEAPF